ncbi:MAG: hypothetical protein IKH72_06180, partial [Firmicutes bacterium]|nr:hypothetical protein [Bacillota bacterium]
MIVRKLFILTGRRVLPPPCNPSHWRNRFAWHLLNERCIFLYINISRGRYKMKKAWFENPDNVVYADIDEFADNFGK